jgi:hypothetical protein
VEKIGTLKAERGKIGPLWPKYTPLEKIVKGSILKTQDPLRREKWRICVDQFLKIKQAVFWTQIDKICILELIK